MVQKTDVYDIQSLDEIPIDKGKFLIIFIPVFVFICNYVNDWYSKYLPVSKGNRLTTIELAAVIIGISIDDIGTAIGMQAEERPRRKVEGNPVMSGLMHWWMKMGLANTETAAHRLTYFMFLSWVLLFQYFGYYTALSRVYMMFVAAMKAWAGYQWWNLKPNNFTVSDFFTFKDGRRVPERMSIPLLHQFNAQSIVEFGEKLKIRRRLVETTPLGWYEKYLPILFPIM